MRSLGIFALQGGEVQCSFCLQFLALDAPRLLFSGCGSGQKHWATVASSPSAPTNLRTSVSFLRMCQESL